MNYRKARVRLRNNPAYIPKPAALRLNNTVVRVSYGYVLEEDHKLYPNEVAWLLHPDDDSEAIAWIASGDLILLEESMFPITRKAWNRLVRSWLDYRYACKCHRIKSQNQGNSTNH